jgi:hypothetical protein
MVRRLWIGDEGGGSLDRAYRFVKRREPIGNFGNFPLAPKSTFDLKRPSYKPHRASEHSISQALASIFSISSRVLR